MGKELIFKTLRHEETERVAWVPFAGVHAGKLLGYTAEELLKEGDKLLPSLLEVNKLYTPDGMPVVFDLQIEAEILGCELMWARDNPPSVKTHPLAGTTEIPTKIPAPEDGRLPMILDVMRKLKAEIGDQTALYGLICGPFTLASHLRGSDIFMDMVTDADYVRSLIAYCAEVCNAVTDMYIDAGMDVIAVVDPLVSQISPKHFTKMLHEGFKTVFDHIREKGAFSSFFVCGNATRQIDVMCKTGPDSVSVDENVDLAAAKQVTDTYNITIGGNIPLTTTMLFGTQQDNMKCVLDILDSVSHKNLIISPGCDMPYDVPVENTVAVAQAVRNPESTAKLLENYVAVEDDIEVDIPDYANLDKVLVELFLLDPAQCAACTYMLAAVVDAYEDIKEFADYRQYKYTNREDIARTKKMGVKNLPSMYINGELAYGSIIPSREELIAKIREYVK